MVQAGLAVDLVMTASHLVVQEGEMRPQLLDRFGMSVSVSTMMDVDVRTQMVLDRLAYEQVTLECAAVADASLRLRGWQH